jgi:hypothetical protein
MNHYAQFLYTILLIIFLNTVLLHCTEKTYTISPNGPTVYAPSLMLNSAHNHYPDMSHIISRAQSYGSNTATLPLFYTTAMYKKYFEEHGFTQQQILNQSCLYMSDEFVKYAQTLDGYEHAIKQLYADTRNVGFIKKCARVIAGSYCHGLQKRIKRLYNKINSKNNQTNHPITFIPIAVQQCSINILNNCYDYESVATQFNEITQHVIHNANAYNLAYIDTLELHIHNALDNIKNPINEAEFVFNVATVDYLLSTIQQQAHDKATAQKTILERSPELLARALTKFITHLNPITQVTSIYDLIKSAAQLTGKAIAHPINTLHDAQTITSHACTFLVNTAYLVTDITLGKLYLSPEEYQQRCNHAWKQCENVTAENIVDLAATVAADIVFFRGFTGALAYLKELDVVSKSGNYAATVAQKCRKAVDKHLQNKPIIVTTEGVALQMSHDLKELGGSVKEVITDSRAFIESMTNGVLKKVKTEIDVLKQQITCPPDCLPDCIRRGFFEINYRHAKIDCEHILSMELNLSKKNKINMSGFHHDFNNGIEKSGLVQLADKTIEANGCYQARPVINGSIIQSKTFFPAHWSREKVIEKIYEAFNDFVKSNKIPTLKPDDKYKIRGFTKEGIEIEMCVTKKGQITTAYPILE